jgi:hypothetical protein
LLTSPLNQFVVDIDSKAQMGHAGAQTGAEGEVMVSIG